MPKRGAKSAGRALQEDLNELVVSGLVGKFDTGNITNSAKAVAHNDFPCGSKAGTRGIQPPHEFGNLHVGKEVAQAIQLGLDSSPGEHLTRTRVSRCHRHQIRAPRLGAGDGVVISISGIRVLPSPGARQAVGVEVAVACHPGAVGVTEQMEGALAAREGAGYIGEIETL